MKTKEELNALKAEVKNLNEKLSALTEDELKQVAGGGKDSGEYAVGGSAMDKYELICD